MPLSPLSLITLLLLVPALHSACSSERCCLVTTCTASYCTQKNSETWISNQNFASYGYTKLVLASSQCVPCGYNCQACIAESTCSTCMAGFYASSGQCMLCGYACLTCVVANGISKCSSCQTGTYLDSSTASCSNCASGASACSSATVITSCLTGYLLTSNSLFCLACPSNCASCPSSSTICASCNTGYYLTNSSCWVCTLSNCSACSFVSSKQTCTSCSSGYFLSSGKCNSCPSNCQTCSSSTTCTRCTTGFYLITGGCLTATTLTDNCNLYSSATACSTCVSGYYLASSKCQPCSLLCSNCYGLHFGQCTACSSSASLFNQMCLPTNHLSNTKYQLYFSYPSAGSLLSGGTGDCNRYLYTGQALSLTLNGMSGYKITVSWRIFSIGGSTTYSASLTNSAGTQTTTFTTSSSSGQSYNLCSSNSSTYWLSATSTTFSTVKVNNTLTFSTNNGINLALQEVLVVIDRCNSLCVECSSVLCTQCLLSNLYTQDAYCVYTCSSGYYLYYNSSSVYDPNSCLQTCPTGTYALSTNLTCASCVAPCLSCLNDAFCLSCISDYFLTQTNTCQKICPYQYYGETLTQTCQKCVGRCNECLDQLRCVNCNSGFYYASNYSCLDSCTPALGITGMYADLATLTCKACAASCLNCLMAADYCTSCPTGKLYYNYTCLTSCPANYYADSNNTCQSCTYPCQNCNGSPTSCLSCTDRYLSGSACMVTCPVGYFQNNQGLVCTACATGCADCVYSASYCTKCSNGYYSFNNTCISSCPAMYYANSSLAQCLTCAGLCRTCLSSTFCLSCSSNFLWNGSCLANSQCPSSYFADITTLSCLACSSSCKTCEFSATTCTSCFANSSTPYLLNATCMSACSSAVFFPNSFNGVPVCTACSSPCFTCTNASYCLSCVEGYMLSGGLCSTACNAGYYFNSTIVDCSACSSRCLVCNTASFCQLCETGYFISSISSTTNQCLQTCPNGYYANTQAGSCQPCVYPCGNCTSSLDCLSCQTGIIYNSRCINSCPDTTFLSPTTATCSDCTSPCLTCFGTALTCLSCQASYFLYSVNNTCLASCFVGTYAQSVTQMCLQCPSSCLSCLNDTYCTACPAGRTYLYPVTHNCITNCPLGYYGNSTSALCLACDPKCLTCSLTSTGCLSCANGFYLVRLSVTSYDCLASCPNGYFKQSQRCDVCVFPCNTCSSASSCLTCVVGTYFYANSSACLLTCPSSSYLDSATSSCLACKAPCLSCKSSSYCLSCTSGLYLNGGSCVSSCPSSTYSDTTLICLACSGLCKTCSSKYYCLSCVTGYLSNGFCYNSCPPGTFANLNTSACVTCTSPCVECAFAANYCTRCMAGLVQFQGNCTSSCPVGTYVSDSSCLSCSFPCINCSSASTCSECLGGYLLYSALICIPDATYCPNDFYKMDGKYCIPLSQCPSNYYTDRTQRVCSASCPPEKYVDKETKTCIYSCRSDQYVGVGMVCTNFSVAPISLMTMSVISFIESSVLNLVVSFNESEIWLNSNSSIYTLTSTSRLLASDSKLSYTLQTSDPKTLLLRVTSMPSSVALRLPAQNLVSSSSGYPLQTPNVTVQLPQYVVYDYSAIYQGYAARQFGEGLGWFIFLLTLVFLFKNRISHLYILWDTVQILYTLLFLNIQYPPTLNQFLRGLSTVFFYGFPSLFPAPTKRQISDRPFYAYATDSSFIRNAGFCLSFLIFVLVFYIFLRIAQAILRRTQIGKKISQTLPRLKKFVFEMLLRYRWHHASDVFFLTYLIVFLFGVAELRHLDSNPGQALSNTLCILSLLLYLVFPFFVASKLYRHFPNISKGKHVQNLRCFYRGVDKTSRFGVFLVVIRYFRKIVYALAVGVFSMSPMYALPILMMISAMMALFIFVNLPYKKRLSNIVEVVTELCIALFYLGIALINFNNDAGNATPNITLGYICTALLIFILLIEVFQVFCRSLFHLESEEELRKKNEVPQDQEELRKKAGEFFDFMFPRIRKQFGFGQDSEEEIHKYQEGDSQNSQNNEERQREWGIESSAHSEEFRHYDNNSQSEQTEPKKQPPEYLVRCVKQLQ